MLWVHTYPSDPQCIVYKYASIQVADRDELGNLQDKAFLMHATTFKVAPTTESAHISP